MNSTAASVTICMRIPGQWMHPRALMEPLPEGNKVSEAGLTLADGSTIEMGALAADSQFAEIFRSSCRQPRWAGDFGQGSAIVDGMIDPGER